MSLDLKKMHIIGAISAFIMCNNSLTWNGHEIPVQHGTLKFIKLAIYYFILWSITEYICSFIIIYFLLLYMLRGHCNFYRMASTIWSWSMNQSSGWITLITSVVVSIWNWRTFEYLFRPRSLKIAWNLLSFLAIVVMTTKTAGQPCGPPFTATGP